MKPSANQTSRWHTPKLNKGLQLGKSSNCCCFFSIRPCLSIWTQNYKYILLIRRPRLMQGGASRITGFWAAAAGVSAGVSAARRSNGQQRQQQQPPAAAATAAAATSSHQQQQQEQQPPAATSSSSSNHYCYHFILASEATFRPSRELFSCR